MTTNAGPKPITIDEYKQRTTRNHPKEEAPLIKTKLPKRRGGYTARRRQRKALLLRIINSDPPPSWQRASELWRQIDEIEEQIRVYIQQKKLQGKE